MATKRDYYEILGISRDATPEQIKEAYKQLARKYHPDMNPDKDKKTAEEKFKEISEAYEVLIDPQKKQLYDQYGHQGVDSQFGPGGFTWENFTHQGDLEDIFGDLLQGMFGGGLSGDSVIDQLFGGSGRRVYRRQQGGYRGQDLRISISLTIQEIATGVTKEIRLKKYESCPTCKGFGGSGNKVCNTCHGAGQIKRVSSSIFGQMVNITTCNACGGRGKVVEKRCSECGGRGRVEKLSTVSVKIPAGVREGNYITLRGQGNAGSEGGPAGDLIVIIEEKEDSIFKRDGNNVFIKMPISFPIATLGGKVEIPTLQDKILLTIPPRTPSGKIFRLQGKGIPVLNGYGRGDELVEVYIDVPKSLSKEADRLIRELGKSI